MGISGGIPRFIRVFDLVVCSSCFLDQPCFNHQSVLFSLTCKQGRRFKGRFGTIWNILEWRYFTLLFGMGIPGGISRCNILEWRYFTLLLGMGILGGISSCFFEWEFMEVFRDF